MDSHQLGIEMVIIIFIFVVAGIMFLTYIKAIPNEDIPREYFFKVREPYIRQKRKMKEEAKKMDVDL